MTNDEMTTAHSLSGEQERRLSALLDTVLPASDDGGMPSARELDILVYLAEQAEDFLPELMAIVDHFDDEFPGLPLSGRVALVADFSKAEAKAFNALLFHIYDCY